METAQKIADFVRNSVAELAGLPIDDVGPDTTIVGDAAILHSRDLVVLMLDIEEFLEVEYKASFDWASNSALSGSSSRLRTVGTLCELVAERATDVT